MKPRKPIRRTSKTRAKKMREYARLKKDFIRSHSYCSVCCSWISPTSRELHHKYGRSGKLLTWEPGFRCVCHRCHNDIHMMPSAAILGEHLGPMGTWNDYEGAVKHHKTNNKTTE